LVFANICISAGPFRYIGDFTGKRDVKLLYTAVLLSYHRFLSVDKPARSWLRADKVSDERRRNETGKWRLQYLEPGFLLGSRGLF
jgi:hypothetical protein